MIQKLLAQELRFVADKLDSGNCNITEQDALEIFDNLANVSMSKEEAASLLNMPVSTFDKKVASGQLPQSHKRKGLTERLWFRRDLIKRFFS